MVKEEGIQKIPILLRYGFSDDKYFLFPVKWRRKCDNFVSLKFGQQLPIPNPSSTYLTIFMFIPFVECEKRILRSIIKIHTIKMTS